MSQSTAAPTVLIVGAGPTGLMAAAQLTRQGVACRLVDQAPHGSETSKALAMHARTLELMDNLGLIDTVLARGLAVKQGNFYDDPSKPPVLELRLDTLDSPYNFSLDIAQSETEAILRDYLHQHGVNVEWQVTLAALTQTDAGVQAVLRHADGREERCDVPWLVAGDGAHSTTRHLLNLSFDGKAYPQGFVLADVKVEWSRSPDEWHFFVTEQGPLAFFPLIGGRQRIIAEVPPSPADAPAPTPTLEQVQQLCVAKGIRDAHLSDPRWLAAFRIHERKAEHYRVGRVFLAGDAVHIHSPAGGQGMNTGLQDACNLAWKLGLVARGLAPAALLDSYEPERSPVADAVLKMSDAMTRMVTLSNPVAAAVRNHLYAVVSQLEVVQHRAADQIGELAISYRHSPIVAEHGGGLAGLHPFGGPHAGERLPDVASLQLHAGEERRLFELLRGPRHTLLLLAGHEPGEPTWKRLLAIAGWVGERAGKFIDCLWAMHGHATGAVSVEAGRLVRDPDGALHARLGARHDALYLIRPDGYVAYRARPAELAPLQEYLGRVYGVKG